MERIKNLMSPGEIILWQKIHAGGKKREKIHVITNKRLYKQSADVLEGDYYGAPSEFLHVKDETLVIERDGIKNLSWKGNRSYSIYMKNAPETKSFMEISPLTPQEFGEVKDILIQPLNILNATSPTLNEQSLSVNHEYTMDQVTRQTHPSQIIKVDDFNFPYGNTCAHCNAPLESLQEQAYVCGECGVYYHESCLNVVIQGGTCVKCGNTLLW